MYPIGFKPYVVLGTAGGFRSCCMERGTCSPCWLSTESDCTAWASNAASDPSSSCCCWSRPSPSCCSVDSESGAAPWVCLSASNSSSALRLSLSARIRPVRSASRSFFSCSRAACDNEAQGGRRVWHGRVTQPPAAVQATSLWVKFKDSCAEPMVF